MHFVILYPYLILIGDLQVTLKLTLEGLCALVYIILRDIEAVSRIATVVFCKIIPILIVFLLLLC